MQEVLEQHDGESTTHARLFPSDRKRFREVESYIVPLITLDVEGTIQHLSAAARRLLEYPEDAEIDDCFFTHVHGKNLYRVMQDVAHMVCFRLKQTSWLLRLQTHTGRYRWFKAEVQNRLSDPAGHIVIVLETL